MSRVRSISAPAGKCPCCKLLTLIETIYRGGKLQSCAMCGYLMCWRKAA